MTVEFHDRDGATEVVLRHDGFRTAQKRDGHEAGWTACLEKLAAVVGTSR